jgi:hypothetical protein
MAFAIITETSLGNPPESADSTCLREEERGIQMQNS